LALSANFYHDERICHDLTLRKTSCSACESCSSANYHEVIEWEVVKNLPVIARRKVSDVDLCENGKDYCIKTVEERIVGDKLQSAVSYAPYDMPDDEEVVEPPAVAESDTQ
jgi:hypothetical protein